MSLLVHMPLAQFNRQLGQLTTQRMMSARQWQLWRVSQSSSPVKLLLVTVLHKVPCALRQAAAASICGRRSPLSRLKQQDKQQRQWWISLRLHQH
jgi:hypothetical protein